jgi:hypothetical protein
MVVGAWSGMSQVELATAVDIGLASNDKSVSPREFPRATSFVVKISVNFDPSTTRCSADVLRYGSALCHGIR